MSRSGADRGRASRRDDRGSRPNLGASKLPVGDWSPVRAPRFETRWFVDGDLPRGLRPSTRSVKRVDRYHAPSMSPGVSVKLRGDTRWLEAKTRSRVDAVTIQGVDAVAERWQKWRAAAKEALRLPGPWIPVDKQIWSIDGLEVARVAIELGVWWSLAFPIGAGKPSCGPLVDRWLGHVREAGVTGSYASWLLDRVPSAQAA